MSLTKATYSMILGAANNILDFGADPTGASDSSAAIQAALNLRGAIYIPAGTYRIVTTLVFKGNSQIFGDGPGVSILKWYGSNTGTVMQDSSVTTTADINLNVIIRDLEIDGNSYATGSTFGLKCYRVGYATFSNLYIHHCGSSLLRWGFSQADTRDINVENCRLEYAREGDACQGAGTNITHRDCTAFSAGDTAFALLYDFSATTNPTALSSKNVSFINCVAVGQYNSSGVYTGSGRAEQTGFAVGPFAIGADAYVSMVDCVCEALYLNAFMTVFDKLTVTNCFFKAAAVTDTGGVRIDGVSTVVFTGNTFENSYVATGPNFCSLLFDARRFTYGASNFDASTQYITVSGNVFQGNSNKALSIACDPVYATVSDVTISGNTFIGHTSPISFLPASGTGTGIYSTISINGNTTNSTATVFVSANGAAAQYSGVTLSANETGAVPPLNLTSNIADNIVVLGNTKLSSVNAASGAATTVYAVPTNGYHTMQITSYVKAGNDASTAIAVVVNNAGDPRIAWQSNGANMTLTLSGTNIQATQSLGSPQDIFTNITYLS